MPSLEVLQRLLAVADLRLTVVDEWGRLVLPMLTWDDRLDGAERRYPAHLDTILDPEPGEWWGDIYGLVQTAGDVPPRPELSATHSASAASGRCAWRKYRNAPPPPWPE